MIANQLKNIVLVFTFLLPFFMGAQTITGTVKDEQGALLYYIQIDEQEATNKTMTDGDGKFELRVSMLPTKIKVHAIGYTEKIVKVTSDSEHLTIILRDKDLGVYEKLSSESIVLDSSLPVSFLRANEFQKSGKLSVEEFLNTKTGSFLGTNQTHADVTTHFSVADLHGLGSSRMLVLVNGKRKNLSAITNINQSYGRGEVGVDLQSIPLAAIDHFEILKDGASAKYGSDAIAGVINIILKKDTDDIIATINTGGTLKGDGIEVGATLHGSVSDKKGAFVNYTFNLQHQKETNRAGDPGEEKYFPITNPTQYDFWFDENPDLGMTVGQPIMSTGNAYFNGVLPFDNKKGEFYATVGVGVRGGESFGIFRAPYLSNYDLFQPKLQTTIADNMSVLGAKIDVSKFIIDVSTNFGFNHTEYQVNDTRNYDIINIPTDYDPNDPTSPQPTSPTVFEAGAHQFYNFIGNVDISREFSYFAFNVGATYKRENFKTIDGEHDSWYRRGAQSFLGLHPNNRVTESRNVVAAYADLNYDITDALLLGASARIDNYSDSTDGIISYKANARYLVGSLGTIRASYGTGFRSPALQQMYSNNTQQLLNSRALLLTSKQRDDLGVSALAAETSTNISAGFILTPIYNLSVTLDYYNVAIDNRIALSSNLGFDNLPAINAVEQVLATEGVQSLRFFSNAINTETQGVDFSVGYNNIRFPKGVLGFDLGVNWNETKIVNDVTPAVSLADYNVLNRTERSRIETGRPSIKGFLGAKYEQDLFHVALNNTYFGEATWKHATDVSKDQTFAGKFVTDVIIGYKYSERIGLNLTVNNALNVYPDEIDNMGDEATNLGGRFKYPNQLNQFGALGMQIRLGASYNF